MTGMECQLLKMLITIEDSFVKLIQYAKFVVEEEEGWLVWNEIPL